MKDIKCLTPENRTLIGSSTFIIFLIALIGLVFSSYGLNEIGWALVDNLFLTIVWFICLASTIVIILALCKVRKIAPC
jgi:hypothetical protein